MLDASVALAWCFPDESDVFAQRVLDALQDGVAVVPAIWALEVANGLLTGERRGRLSAADVARFAELLDRLSLGIDSLAWDRAVSHVLPLARAQGLSAYDAAYLELAMREQLSIATLDERLRRAAGVVGVSLFS